MLRLNLKWLVVLIPFFIMLSSCNKDDEIVNPGNQHNLVLKGNIPALYKSGALKLNSSNADSVIAKVIVFYPKGSYNIAEVKDGKFSIGVQTGTPAFLVFAGASDNYLGYLRLREGFESIPLVKVDENISTIDLQDIFLSNKVGSPSHNPLGNEIMLTEEEQQILSFLDDFFYPIVKNPDVDGNGKMDFLENKFYRLQILWFYRGGSFGNNLTPGFSIPLQYDGWRLAFSAQESNQPQSVNFYFPWNLSSPLPSEQTRLISEWNTMVYFSPLITQSLPIGGIYKVAYKTMTLNFEIPDQSSALNNVPVIVPTVSLNNDSTIKSISWSFINPNGMGTIDPTSFATVVNFGIESSVANYESPNVEASNYQYTINQVINWSSVTRVWIAYHDLYDNHYIFFYSK
jgi:hypothetical protein